MHHFTKTCRQAQCCSQEVWLDSKQRIHLPLHIGFWYWWMILSRPPLHSRPPHMSRIAMLVGRCTILRNSSSYGSWVLMLAYFLPEHRSLRHCKPLRFSFWREIGLACSFDFIFLSLYCTMMIFVNYDFLQRFFWLFDCYHNMKFL